MISNGRVRRRGTLVRRLVLGVNLTLAGFLGLFVTLDVYFARRNLLREKAADLQELATRLMISAAHVRDRGKPALQRFLNDAARPLAPGADADRTHFIILQLDGEILEARSVAPPGLETLRELRSAAVSRNRRVSFAGQDVIVGAAQRGDMALYILEPYAGIEHTIFFMILRRAAANTLVGLAIAALLNLMLRLWLVRPLRAMVDTVQHFGRGELSARMPPMRGAELALLADEFNLMANVLERNEVQRRRQMERARAIQDCLRPDFQKIPGARFACLYQPAAEVAGDYYDVLPMADGGVLLCIADVSGHGVPAAMGAAMLKTLLLNGVERESDPAKLLALLNAAYFRVTLPSDFATMSLFRFAPGSPKATYASAGHEPVFLLRASGRVEDLKATGYPIGVEAPSAWDTLALTVEPGDRLVMLTNGLVETPGANGEKYGRDRMLRDVVELRAKPLDQMLAGLLERVAAFRGREPQSDDLTALAVEFPAAETRQPGLDKQA